MYNPLEQFKYKYIIDFYNQYLDLSISLPIFILIFIYIIITIWFNNSKIRYIIYKLYNIFDNTFGKILTISNINYLPFILFTFFYILIINIFGLLPYTYTITCQFIVTFFWSSTIIITATLLGLSKHKLRFFTLFIPKGVPSYLKGFIFIIELISYLSRILSLAVRLSTNIIAGHTLIFIISWFGSYLSIYGNILIIIPILILILLLEIGVSIIQAYVFALLMSSYIKDTLNLH